MTEIKPKIDEISIKRIVIDEYPEVIYEIPSGRPGYKIVVSEEPHDLTIEYVKDEFISNPDIGPSLNCEHHNISRSLGKPSYCYDCGEEL